MKNALLILLMFILILNISYSQYIPDSRIDSIVNLISQQRISKYMRELTGDTLTTVGGFSRLIYSRFYLSPSNDVAAQYILEKFQSFGLTASIQGIDASCRNVIAVKPGSKFPNQKYIVGAHYDNILWPVNPGPYDTVHGADDNCSGVCGVLEAAKLLANMNLDYTVVFAAWDQEEYGNVWGAGAYVDSAYMRHDSIKGYINMDMIAWNSAGMNKYWAGPDTNSKFFYSIFTSLSSRFIPNFTPVYYSAENYGSDQLAFLRKGYKSFNVAEYGVSSNPNYHKITDTYSNANIPYAASLLKPTLAMLTAFALNKTVYFEHKPLLSTYDTAWRSANVFIKFPGGLSTVAHTPRLYYSINSGPYIFKTCYYRNQDTFKFKIPGSVSGSQIKYYIAAQDTAGSFVCTYPVGGSGVNPPGYIPPQTFFSYQIYADYSQCSSTLPKPIVDYGITKDTIDINYPGYIEKMKVNLSLNHQNDGDLIIQLQIPGSATVNLTQRNGGGGQNFTNTTFDDDAVLSITQGTPPYTGSFRPITGLITFKGLPLSSRWVLRILDALTGNTGTLTNWCLLFKVSTSVNVVEETVPVKYELSQNYPNPFNSTTRINYSIPKNSNVELKIYDMLGREIRTLVSEHQNAGNYVVMFNAGDLASGMYFYKVTAGDFTSIKKMVLVK